MSDPLRDRIAAIVANLICGEWCTQQGTTIPCAECVEACLPTVDGLIAELGLREESRQRSYGRWILPPMDRTQRRWVTDWRTDKPACNPHPDAPHGFDRNASLNEDRYVCDCEGWVPDFEESSSSSSAPKSDQSLLDRIAAVVARHDWSPDGTGDGQCECDARWFRSQELWRRHVADAVLAELGPAE